MRAFRALVAAVSILAVSGCQAGDLEAGAGSMDPLPLPIEMIVLGDFGDGGQAQRQVASTMREVVSDRDISVLVTTGDNFYSDDVERIWVQPYSWIEASGIEIAAAWGNHDVESELRRNLVQEALDPPGHWYSAPLGRQGRLIVLDSNHVGDRDQARWFESQLEAAGSPSSSSTIPHSAVAATAVKPQSTSTGCPSSTTTAWIWSSTGTSTTISASKSVGPPMSSREVGDGA